MYRRNKNYIGEFVGATDVGLLDGLNEGILQLGATVGFNEICADKIAVGTLVGFDEARILDGDEDGTFEVGNSPTLCKGAVTDSVNFFQATVKLPKNGLML